MTVSPMILIMMTINQLTKLRWWQASKNGLVLAWEKVAGQSHASNSHMLVVSHMLSPRQSTGNWIKNHFPMMFTRSLLATAAKTADRRRHIARCWSSVVVNFLRLLTLPLLQNTQWKKSLHHASLPFSGLLDKREFKFYTSTSVLWGAFWILIGGHVLSLCVPLVIH